MLYINRAQLEHRLDELQRNFFLIDTRDQEEYREGYIPSALSMPSHEILEKLKGVSKDRELIVYCHNDDCITDIALSLENQGYTNIKIFHGGWEEWAGRETDN